MMRTRNVLTILLLLFVASAVVYMIFSETGQDSLTATIADTTAVNESSASQKNATEGDHKVVVYYFHGTRRCNTCRKLEAYSTEAIQTGFFEEIGSGKLEWHVVNYDEPENEHYLDDYQLTNQAVVMVDVAGGEQVDWKNLTDIWNLVHDKPAFLTYVQTEVASRLGEH